MTSVTEAIGRGMNRITPAHIRADYRHATLGRTALARTHRPTAFKVIDNPVQRFDAFPKHRDFVVRDRR